MGKLVARGVSKEYQGKNIIEDISIYVDPGEIVSLLGVSGVGKTTLFNILSGLESPNLGEVFLDGEDITNKAGYISYMLQKDLLFPHKKIIENVTLPLIINGVKKEEAYERAKKYFSIFQIDGSEDKYPSELSGGMKQRAALLRTYLFSEKFALLDEPFSALDTMTKTNIHKWYLNIMDKISLSTLFITHDIDEAIYLSNRIYIMSGKPGRIVGEIIINKKNTFNDEFILSDKFIEYKKEVLKFFKD